MTVGQFSNSFPTHFSYLCEYAFICDLSPSFCEYPIIFHCLHCSPSCFDPDSLLFAYHWLGLSWIDYISANKRFSSSKTSSRKPYTNSKQQERQKHSAENTINFSHQDDDARGKPATPSTPSTTTQGGTQRPTGPDDLGDPGSRKHAPGTPHPHPNHAVHGERQDPTTRDYTNYDPGTADKPEPRGGETTRGGGGDTTPTGTGTRPNPITTYRLQCHKPYRKYRNTPAYPERGPHGVQPKHILQPHNTGRRLRPDTRTGPVTAHGLQRLNHVSIHKRRAVQAYTEPQPHGIQRPRHGPLRHTSP